MTFRVTFFCFVLFSSGERDENSLFTQISGSKACTLGTAFPWAVLAVGLENPLMQDV